MENSNNNIKRNQVKNPNQEALKKGMIAGAGVVGGVGVGVAATMALSSDAKAEEPVQPQVEQPIEQHHTTTSTVHTENVHNISEVHAPHNHNVDNHMHAGHGMIDDLNPIDEPPLVDPEPIDPVDPYEPGAGEVEVLGYERVTNDDGSQMDVAVASIDGDVVALVDVDIDGTADYLLHDDNQNGEFEVDEMHDVQGAGIEMAPLQAAAGFDPVMDDPNMMPPTVDDQMADYVPDADVDDFMA